MAAWLTKLVDIDRFLGAVEALAGPSRPARRAPPATHAHRAARVLVVDDEPLIRDLIVEHLAEEGFEPHAAGSIAEMRVRMAAQQPALALWRGIPVLVLSAAPEDGQLEPKELGADGVLSKPVRLGRAECLAAQETALMPSFTAVPPRLASRQPEAAAGNTVGHPRKGLAPREPGGGTASVKPKGYGGRAGAGDSLTGKSRRRCVCDE